MLTRVITLNSILIATLTSMIMMLVLLFIRKKDKYFDKINPKIFLAIYSLCLIRMIMPIEFDGYTWPISGGIIWRLAHDLLTYQVLCFGLFKIDALDIIFIIWVVVATAKIHKYIKNYRQVHRLFWNYPSDKDVRKFISLNNTRFIKTKVITVPYIDSPCCIGIFKRVIVLPDIYYTKNEFIQILRHENEHLVNNDVLAKIIVNILCRIYWWNPIAFFLQANFNQSMEICCDMRVINSYSEDSKIEYLETILREYKRNINKSFASEMMLAMADGDADELYERFRVISSKREKKSLRNHVILGLIIIMIYILSYSFVIQACYEPSEIDINASEQHSFDAHNSYIKNSSNGKYYIYYKDSIIDKTVPLYEIKESELDFYEEIGIKIKDN